jgi:hypothetical protein
MRSRFSGHARRFQDALRILKARPSFSRCTGILAKRTPSWQKPTANPESALAVLRTRSAS